MREEKQLLLDEIKEKIEESKGFIIAGYQGFSSVRIREFRDKMAEAGGEFEVVRKRIFIKAAETLGIKFDFNVFQGHIGIIFAREDVTQITKDVVKYGEEHDKVIVVLGGQIEGKKCSAEDLEAIAKLPSLLELRAQFLAQLEAPMTQTVGVVQAVLTSILYCIEEKGKKD